MSDEEDDSPVIEWFLEDGPPGPFDFIKDHYGEALEGIESENSMQRLFKRWLLFRLMYGRSPTPEEAETIAEEVLEEHE